MPKRKNSPNRKRGELKKLKRQMEKIQEQLNHIQDSESSSTENTSVPVSISNELTNSIEEEDEENEVSALEDDSTTHGLERLSSAATCLVAGVEYTHGQQIYRHDPCEFCLCLDGEMFCWWQDCPPTMEGPCRDKGPFSPCMTVTDSQSPVVSSTSSPDTTTKINPVNSSTEQLTGLTQDQFSSRSTDDTEFSTDALIPSEHTNVEVSSGIPELSTAKETKFCVIMGKVYQIGDRLPHDTGNCLECICGQGAKVTCSPHQCAPAGDEINDYRLPGPRQPVVPDIF